MGSSEVYLGIDSGQSKIKIAAFDEYGNQIMLVDESLRILTPKSGFYEIDVEELWLKTRKLLRKITRKISPHNIKCIGICGHAGGFYALDYNLRPFKKGILPIDERAKSVISKLDWEHVSKEFFKKTGMPLMTGFPIMILRWLKEGEKQKYKGIKYILSRKDLIRYLLTGEISTDITDACFGFLNVYTQNYDKEIFELIEIVDAFDYLPELRTASYEIVGHVSCEASKETGLNEGTPVIVGAHDACCNLIGSGAIESRSMCSAGGTWSINMILTDKPVLNMKWSCESFIIKGKWMLEQYSPTAAICLNWFINNFLSEEIQKAKSNGANIYDVINEKIANVETHVIFLPFIMGLPSGYPYSSNASAAFIGLRFEDDKVKLLRALYEGIAFVKAVHIEEYERFFPIEEIRFTGGMAKSNIFCQLLADITGKNVLTVDKEETGCFGVAFLGMMGLGYAKELKDVLQYLKISRIYQPRREYSNTYNSKYILFKKCCLVLDGIWSMIEEMRKKEMVK
jgi:L-xylulokinase